MESRLNKQKLAPGAVVEEVEEGRTLPAVTALTDRTHEHYPIESNGRSQRSSRRRDVRDYMRDQGVLGLANRERDPELDRDMMDREIAKQRDHHLLALLDRERERELNEAMVDRDTTKQRDERLHTLLDRGGKDIMELLTQKLERGRDLRPGGRTSGQNKMILKARGESRNNSEDGLRAEMEALRNDFRKLMRSASRTSGDVETKKARREDCAVSGVTSRLSGRQKPLADIRFTPGMAKNDEESEAVDDDESLDQSASSSRRIFEHGRTDMAQVLQVPLPTDEATNSS